MKVVESPVGVARLVGDVAAAPDEVYRYFTDADLLVQWWPEEANVDDRSGRYEMSWPSQGMRLLGQYVVREPGRRLAFTWAFAHEAFQPRTVDIKFEESDVGTQLTIEHTHGDDADERQGYIDGWKYFVERLRGVVPTG
jgi:uncharacterized protein YndB with AHSA1/START domain